MDWLTINPTQIELELDGATPLALLESLLEKMAPPGVGGVVVAFQEAGEIFRLDGNLYDYADYTLQIITATPELNLNLEDMVN